MAGSSCDSVHWAGQRQNTPADGWQRAPRSLLVLLVRHVGEGAREGLRRRQLTPRRREDHLTIIPLPLLPPPPPHDTITRTLSSCSDWFDRGLTKRAQTWLMSFVTPMPRWVMRLTISFSWFRSEISTARTPSCLHQDISPKVHTLRRSQRKASTLGACDCE